MREPKIINHPNMKVILRKDFHEIFMDQLNKITHDTGATYFGHNIIKNYGEKGHRVSTFCNRESWHDLYWDKYYNNDSTEKTCHQATQENNFMVVSWEITRSSSQCTQERMKMNNVKDGIIFSFKRPEKYLESFLIGWETLNTDQLDTDYIFHLTNLLKPIRDHHWAVHDKV